MEELLKRIVIDPRIMLGKPVVRGTRITVEHILRRLAVGWSDAELLDAHPHLAVEDIRAAVAYAAERVAQDRVLILAE